MPIFGTPARPTDLRSPDVVVARYTAFEGLMPKVTFLEHDGTARIIEAANGLSVMEAAVQNGVAGILAECGGACACATCHVIVDPDWFGRVGPTSESEREVMVFAATPPSATSRLSCQIKLTDTLDGLVVRVPDNQS